MKVDKRAKRAKQKTKAANVARQREKTTGQGSQYKYLLNAPSDAMLVFIDLIDFLHDQNRADCNEIIEGLNATMTKTADGTTVFNGSWLNRAIDKREEIEGK